jgi:beta-lactam-binding protein with PASTA domain
MSNNVLAFFGSRMFLMNLVYGLFALVLFFGGSYLWLDTYTRHNESVAVPNMTGKSLFESMDQLESQGFRVKISDSSTYDPKRKPGLILDQDPLPGTRVKDGRTLYFSITRKTPPEVKMPSLVDNSLRQAEATLHAFGLVRGEVILKPDLAKNAVLEMQVNGKKVDPGFKVDKGTVVDLVVGQGLNTSRVMLPNLYNLTFQEAVFVLQASGLSTGLTIFDPSVRDSLNCKVYRQNPQFRLQETVLFGESIDLFLTESEETLNSNYINPNIPIEDEF